MNARRSSLSFCASICDWLHENTARKMPSVAIAISTVAVAANEIAAFARIDRIASREKNRKRPPIGLLSPTW